jgi:hypothetical protein
MVLLIVVGLGYTMMRSALERRNTGIVRSVFYTAQQQIAHGVMHFLSEQEYMQRVTGNGCKSPIGSIGSDMMYISEDV